MVKIILVVLILINTIVYASDYIEFNARTGSYHGEFAPENCGAIWICDENDNFIKTLSVWAIHRRAEVIKWNEMTGGNTIDAVTSATLKKHQSHSLKWDLTDYHGNIVEDGVYRFYIEFTEDNSSRPHQDPGRWKSFEFVKDSRPRDTSFAETDFFSDVSIDYAVTSGINHDENGSISAFPNPFSSETNIQIVESLIPCNIIIYNVLGEKCRELFISKEGGYSIDLSAFPAGIYFCIVSTKNKSYSIKLIHSGE